MFDQLFYPSKSCVLICKEGMLRNIYQRTQGIHYSGKDIIHKECIMVACFLFMVAEKARVFSTLLHQSGALDFRLHRIVDFYIWY